MKLVAETYSRRQHRVTLGFTTMSQRKVLPEFDGRLMDGLLFCRRVYRYFENIRGGPQGKSLLRRRNNPELKKLVEELIPLAVFIQRKYSAAVQIRVRWRAGNQSFDAQLYRSGGAVEVGVYSRRFYVEITNAMHRNDYYSRLLVDSQRVSFGPISISKNAEGELTSTPSVWRNYEFLESMVATIRDAVAKKTAKVYPQNTVLLVSCTFERTVLPEEWEEAITQVKKTVNIRPFPEVFLLDAAGYLTASIYAHKE